MADKKLLKSMILWGVAGIGKTTIAKALAHETDAVFRELNATDSGVKDVRNLITAASKSPETQTVVFIDEVHRFSKSQQDVLLPAVENGTITLIGATTEKPKFAVNATIISRSSVYELKPLSQKDLLKLLLKIKKHYELQGRKITIDREAVDTLITRCSGDARKLITAMETIVEVLIDDDHIATAHVDIAIPEKHLVFDRSGNEHFDSAHAYQECIQHSDVNGAMYWLAQWLASGEDPAYITRRMLITAFEDCAANPLVPLLAAACCMVTERTGPPECHIAMGLVTTYMAQAERDKTGHDAILKALDDVARKATVRVPTQMRAGSGYVKEITAEYVTTDLMAKFLGSFNRTD